MHQLPVLRRKGRPETCRSRSRSLLPSLRACLPQSQQLIPRQARLFLPSPASHNPWELSFLNCLQARAGCPRPSLAWDYKFWQLTRLRFQAFLQSRWT